MSAVVAQMRRAIGADGANVTLARNLLAPVASHLFSGGGGDLHRRCVLFDCAPPRARVADVLAALAPPPPGGAVIEAVALSEHLAAAVVVFATPAGAETALMRAPARGSCHAVPPLELGAEMPVIRPTDVKIMSDSVRIPTATGSPECGTPGAYTPRGTKRFRDMIAGDDSRGMRMEYGDSIRGVTRTDNPPPPEKRRAGVPDTAVCFESF